jgi:UDP-N-acetylglucosamine--dolichyl-phosphate N-acetylglucosaminephosphotransferase
MAFAVVGIQAHFSKTLLLFFIPQIFNFVLSCPQLFGLVPCPRHRVPRYTINFCSTCTLWHHPPRFDAQTNLLYPSKALFPKPPKPLSVLVLRVLAALGLTELTTHPTTGVILEATNLTILNFFLLRLGPLSEKRLVQVLMASQVRSCLDDPSAMTNEFGHWQVTGSLFAFAVRYGLAGLVYDGDRR